MKAEDGRQIHVFNEGLVCPGAPRAIFRPKLELEGAPPEVEAVRIRFYQVK